MNLTRYLKKQEDWIPYINKRKELQRLIPITIKGANFVPIYDLQKNMLRLDPILILKENFGNSQNKIFPVNNSQYPNPKQWIIS